VSKAEIKASLLANLEDRLDPYMRQNGFLRHTTSLIYARHIHGSTQKIDMLIEIHPKDNPNAAAAIYPTMQVLVPVVDELRRAMIGDDFGLLEGITGAISRQPIGFTSQKADPGRWYVYQPDFMPGLVDEIEIFIERWAMPFLDVYATPEELLTAHLKNDGRIVADRAQLMRVVAAALVCKQKDYARELMEQKLGTLGARKRYERVYKFVEQA
jgi:hypothetical protein